MNGSVLKMKMSDSGNGILTFYSPKISRGALNDAPRFGTPFVNFFLNEIFKVYGFSVQDIVAWGGAIVRDVGMPFDADRFAKIITGSSWNQRVLARHGYTRGVFCPQGVDLNRFKPLPRQNSFAGRFTIFSGAATRRRHAG